MGDWEIFMVEKKCCIEGCDKKSRTKNMCSMHYARLWRSGTTDAPPEPTGKTQHPLYITWMGAVRGKRICEEWRASFEKFVEDVSPVPEGNWRLKRKDVKAPYSKENVAWKMVRDGIEDEKEFNDHLNAKKRERYKEMGSRNRSLKRNYGITEDQYNEMLAAQGGGCGICGQQETQNCGWTGKKRNLCVDHAHDGTRRVRGILCSSCNTGLGKFKENEELFRRAMEWIKK